jgi:hypothetical protein
MINKQLKNVDASKKFKLNDIHRICKYVNSSIFTKDACCVWTGYITNKYNLVKGTYINFYFKNKKLALHRLLYINFVGPLTNEEYIKFTCNNKGICCNINHLKKYKYNKKPNNNANDLENNDEPVAQLPNNIANDVINNINDNPDNNINTNTNAKKMYLTFD